jgi:hypothetical protein
MNDHVKIIGILWIIFGAFSLFAAAVLFMILFGVSFFHGVLEDPVAPGILRLIAVLVSGFLALLGVPKIIGGYGLLKGKEWGRIVVLIVSFLSLLSMPFGTALGIYSIIILFNKETAALFQSGPKPVPPVS